MEYGTRESKKISELCGYDVVDGTGDDHEDPGWREDGIQGPSVQAGRFEYHEPHNLNNSFSPLKGSEPNF